MSDHLNEWITRCDAIHAREVSNGEHDETCEYGKTSVDGARLMLCHCSKRRRLANGHDELPAAGLEFAAPICPRCGEEVSSDGDGFVCYPCSISFYDNGLPAAFIDDYGSINVSSEAD